MNKYNGLKVLYVGSPPLFSKGASSIHMLKMCQAMSRLKIDIELILPGLFSKHKLFKYYGIKTNFKVISIPFTDLFLRQIIHGVVSAFYVFLFKRDYDFVITRNLIFCYMACVIFKIPTIYDAHHPAVNKFAEVLIKSFCSSKSFLGMSFNSKGLLEIYRNNFNLDLDKSVVAHNGVDLTDYEDTGDVTELRNELKLPFNRKLVCYSGNTYKGRGIENLIKAAEKLPDIDFIVVGGLETDNSVYRNMVNEKNLLNFRIEGFVDHSKVSKYLLASDILVLPYSNEITIKDGTQAKQFTSPIKLFEYLASGKPIVATDLPSIIEILRNNENSIIVEPDNVDALVNSLQKLYFDNELSERISKKALSDAKNYSWEKRVIRIIDGLNILRKYMLLLRN